MDLSIIIVSWNTKDFLHRCLTSIPTNSEGIKVQTILVDNSSVDGSPEMVRDAFPWVQLVQSGGNLGFARGCNLGLKFATAPLVLFLNPDTEAVGSALRKMVDFMKASPRVGALSCKVLEPDGSGFGPGLQWFPSPFTELFKYVVVSNKSLWLLQKCLPYPKATVSAPVSKLYGTAMLVRRDVLANVGSFDERFFMYCEDVDLSRRIEKAGWQLYYLSEAAVLHLGGAASAKVPGKFSVLMMCESISKLMRKYYGITGSIGYRISVILGACFRLVLLTIIRCLNAIGVSRGTSPDASVQKYITSLLWAVGLRKPTIPS